MSQVIVTSDKLNARRKESAQQEHKIDREGRMKLWRRDDVTKFDPIAAAVGVAVAPVVGIFWILTKVTQIAIYFALLLSKVISKIVGPMKSP